MFCSGIELLGYQICLPTSVAYSEGKPGDLDWFGAGLDIIVELLETGIDVDNVHHTFEFAYYVAGIPTVVLKGPCTRFGVI